MSSDGPIPSREELGARLSGLTATGHREGGVFASGASPGPLPDAGGPREGDLRDDTMVYALREPSRLAILPLAATSPAVQDTATLVALSADASATPIKISATVVDSSPALLIYQFPPNLAVPEGTVEALEDAYAFRGGPVISGAGEVIGMHITTRRHEGRLYGAAVPAAALGEQLRLLRDEDAGAHPRQPEPPPAASATAPPADVPAVPRPPEPVADSTRP